MPPEQFAPLALLLVVHTPPEHNAALQGTLVLQAAQLPPPEPHRLVLVPTWQVLPLTQPVQQLPPRHLPPDPPLLQVVPLVLLDVPHFPPLQDGTLHGSLVLQVAQPTPLLPQ